MAASKKVLLGVTGCIAAYKACEILRLLQKADVEIRVVMTENATKFVGVQTFAALTRMPVGVEEFDNMNDPIPHIDAADWCDLFLIAPCTANVAAKLAAGIADDLLTSTALATTSPIVVAPAMNVHMYENAATQANLQTLKSRGIHVLDADSGHLACGYEGKGRLPEPENICDAVLKILGVHGSSALSGKKVVITSGPTVEPIDPVRFISNRSSGKMGNALADQALDNGADVVVISGPVSVEYPSNARVISVQTAEEMLSAVKAECFDASILICAAAVADYRPAKSFDHKLKKGASDEDLSTIQLIENPDILKTVATGVDRPEVVVGFAAETNDVLENAKGKLHSKGVDIIVANLVGESIGFGQDSETAVIVSRDGEEELACANKQLIAKRIIEVASSML